MMLENRITNSLESNVTNHTDLINKTSTSVTQSYVDKVKNSTQVKTSIVQSTELKNIRISGNAVLEILQEGSIQGSLIAQNMITNETSDKTDLGSVMSTAMKQAVDSQTELDTSQKAVNVMEQMDQNNGGIEGMVAKIADTVTNVFGGGNTEQDVKNIMNSSIKQNVNNKLKMENIIDTNVSKNFKTDTTNLCEAELSIEQITKMENIILSDNAKLSDIKKASIDSAVKCFNEVYNIRAIATDVKTSSGVSADQALTALAGLKSGQDVDNKLKQTKLQKNFMDSMMGSCGGSMIMVVLVVVVLGKGKGGGGGGGGGGGIGGGKMGMIFGLFILVFIIGVIVLLVQHREAFAGTQLGDTLDKIGALNPSTRLIFEEERDGQNMYYKIFDAKNNMQLVMSGESASIQNIEDRPEDAQNLEFRDVESDTKFKFVEIDVIHEVTTAASGTTQGPRQDNEPEPKRYKILTHDNRYQLGLLYSDNVRTDGKKIIVEPILYLESKLSEEGKNKFVFSISPELDPDNISQIGYTISHVNKNKEGDPDDHDLENDMIGFLQLSNKPLNGGLFREEEDYELKGAEFRFD